MQYPNIENDLLLTIKLHSSISTMLDFAFVFMYIYIICVCGLVSEIINGVQTSIAYCTLLNIIMW